MFGIPDGILIALIAAIIGGGAGQTWRAIRSGEHVDERTDAETADLVTTITQKVMAIANQQIDDLLEERQATETALAEHIDKLKDCLGEIKVQGHEIEKQDERITILEDRLENAGLSTNG